MCRSVHVRLTSSEQKAVAKWTGVMIPVYALIGLFFLVTLTLAPQLRADKTIAIAAGSANPSAATLSNRHQDEYLTEQP